MVNIVQIAIIRYVTQAFLGSQSKTIEYVAIQCAQVNVQLDDQILEMFLRLSRPSESSVKHNICMLQALSSEAEDFMDSSLLVRHFIFQGLSIDLDVHLSKSPWLPIAIDASRCVPLSILWLLKFEPCYVVIIQRYFRLVVIFNVQGEITNRRV